MSIKNIKFNVWVIISNHMQVTLVSISLSKNEFYIYQKCCEISTSSSSSSSSSRFQCIKSLADACGGNDKDLVAFNKFIQFHLIWLYHSDDWLCVCAAALKDATFKEAAAFNEAIAAAVAAVCDTIDELIKFSNFLVSGLNMGCLNLQCVLKLSLRVYVARHNGHSNRPGKCTW